MIKFKDVKGPKALEVFADMLDHLDKLLADEVVVSFFCDKLTAQGLTSGLRHLVQHHGDTILSILASLSGVTRMDYEEKMTLQSFFDDIVSLKMEGSFVSFFIIAQRQSGSGAVSANTVALKD